MSVTHFKRYRMELDLRGRRFDLPPLPPDYRVTAWRPDLLNDHAEAKYHSFRGEIDADVFTCLGNLEGCQQLMAEIIRKDGFLPESTWLCLFAGAGGYQCEPCGTIQGIRVSSRYGGIQNVGITPLHRGRGIGSHLIAAALGGFQQAGLQRAYLEVTAKNDGAVRLYRRMGFRRSKTLYKSVELAYCAASR